MPITSIKFRNYKALRNYSVSLQAMNLLVGPNNSGKSTILSALRILEYAMRIARSKTAIRITTAEEEWAYGHHIPAENMPSSLENVHSDYSDDHSTIEFNVEKGKKLTLFFPNDGGCILYWSSPGKPITTPSAFRQHFPINIKVIPVLGPLEQEEPIVVDQTVKRAAGTPRASRHFRNYWRQNPEGFSSFKELVEQTWPGMSINPPELNVADQRLVMFCTEDRIDRELFWAGFGFQIWCQLLTHIAQCQDADWIIVDEPEVYLHPDVQRQLLAILRDVKPNVILATHSIEILGEADPTEILVVDKTKGSTKRLKDVEGIQDAITSLGSIQNITLTHLARTKKIIFTEGATDYKIIRRFASVLGLTSLSAGLDLTPLESGGFTSWDKVKSLSWGMKNTIGADIKIGAIYDHDYWCEEKIKHTWSSLSSELAFAHIHGRKEIENYLLVPKVLDRVLEKLFSEKEKTNGKPIIDRKYSVELLELVTGDLKNKIQSQYIAKYLEHFKSGGKDTSSLMLEVIGWFEGKWSELEHRLEIVPGKETLRAFRTEIDNRWGISVSDIRIIGEFRKDEVPKDFVTLLTELEKYRLN